MENSVPTGPDIGVLRQYLDLGFWLIPGSTTTKQPIVEWKDYTNEQTSSNLIKTPEMLERAITKGVELYHPPKNGKPERWSRKQRITVFLICPHQCGFVGLDLDRNHGNGEDGVANFHGMIGAGYEPIVWTETASGGRHYLFRNPANEPYTTGKSIKSRVTGENYPGVDVRGVQGLLVAAGSYATKNGEPRFYTLHGELKDCPEIPANIGKHLQTKRNPGQAVKQSGIVHTAQEFLDSLRSAPIEGKDLTDAPCDRNDDLYWFFCRCAQKGFPRDTLLELTRTNFPLYYEQKGQAHIWSNIESAYNSNEAQEDAARADQNKPMPKENWDIRHCFLKENEDGSVTIKPKPAVTNVKAMLDWYGIEVKENLMTKEPESNLTKKREGKIENAALGQLTHLCVINDFPVLQQVMLYYGQIANENAYHPVRAWLDPIKWDGVSRFGDLMDTIHCPEDYSPFLKEKILTRWLISGVAALYEPRFSTRLTLVLQGPQSKGKTRWLERLFPVGLDCFKESMGLRPDSKDSIQMATSYWCCELGELGGIFRKADIEQLKAFLSQTTDIYRTAYDRMPERYPRRTFFCGTVNQMNFLADGTGSTRFGVIKVESCEYRHDIDIGQLWAEVKTWYENGTQWWLTPDEEAFMEQSNQQFHEVDPLEETLFKVFDFSSMERKILTCTEVMNAIGYERPTKADANRLAIILGNRGVPKKRNSAKSGFEMPIPKDLQELKARNYGNVSL
jgi:Virulence-associated protein E-like domain/Bifunctional DNA primase/polymerase, N-terminal